MKNVISTELCKQCAECCKNYPFVELSITEISLLEQVTGLYFDVFANPKDKAFEEYFLQFQKNGDCFFLNKNKGNYSCCVYEARPGTCKNYPLESKQQEVCEANREKFLSNNFG